MNLQRGCSGNILSLTAPPGTITRQCSSETVGINKVESYAPQADVGIAVFIICFKVLPSNPLKGGPR